jgi:hypothetical protein
LELTAATGGPWSEGAFYIRFERLLTVIQMHDDNKKQQQNSMYVPKRPQVGQSPVAFVPFIHNFKLATGWNTNEHISVKCERRE